MENAILGIICALAWCFWLYGFAAGWYYDDNGNLQ